MTMQKEFNVAIVGYGLAGATFHAPLIKSTDGLLIKSIVTRSPEKQAQAKEDFPEAEIFSDFETLIKHAENIDLCVIATPNKEHMPQALKSLQAGIATVIDKPIATNSAECKELIATSSKSGVLLSVFQNRRWDNDFLTIKKLISEGKLGQILRFESRFERYRPIPKAGGWRETISAEEGGGILFDLGSHLVDQALQLFGKPEQVYAECNIRREGIISDDDSFVALSFPNGVRAHLWMSALSASLGHRFRILGTEGAYEKYGLDPQEDALRAGKTPKYSNWGEEAPSAWGTLSTYENGQQKRCALQTEKGNYLQYYAKMRDAMAGNCALPVEASEALVTMQVIEAARESANKKQAVCFG